MKTARKPATDDDMRPEYDFSKLKPVRSRLLPKIAGCGSFRLWSELHPHFEHGDQVERALRQWVNEHRPPRQDRRARLDLRASSTRFVGKETGLVRGFWFARDLVPFFPTEASVNAALAEWLAEHPPRRRRRRAARA